MVSGQGRRRACPCRQCQWQGRGCRCRPAQDAAHGPHCRVAQRATEAVDRIDRTLNAARLRGDLAFFNSAYKARRAAAAAQGRGFMSYGVALRRLRKAVASVAANGGAVTRSLMSSVFDDVES